MLFHVPVTKQWLHQLTLSLTLICHSSFRGVVELIRDMLGVTISEAAVHNLHQIAIERAGSHNRAQDLSAIRQALLDEIFHCNQPVLVGVDARSTYCFLLAAEAHRDAETWAIHHLYAQDQGFDPDYTVADGGTGLRAGQKLVSPHTPCHGDVFHIRQQCEGVANTLSNIAKGTTLSTITTSARLHLEAKAGKTHPLDPDIGGQVVSAIRNENLAHALARDIRTLTQWLGHDILSLAGPTLAVRQNLFDYVVTEIAAREHLDAKRLRPLRIALQNQRDDLLAFAGVLDEKLNDIARAHHALSVSGTTGLCAATQVRRLPHVLGKLVPAMHPDRTPLSRCGSRRNRSHGPNTALQFNGRKPEFTSAQLFHLASSARRGLPEFAAVLPQSPCIPPQQGS